MEKLQINEFESNFKSTGNAMEMGNVATAIHFHEHSINIPNGPGEMGFIVITSVPVSVECF